MTTATDEAVTIRPDLLAPALLRFVRDSCLSNCTKTEQHPNGWAVVSPLWPPAGFSTGEKIAWGILGALVSGDLHDAFDRFDTGSLRALAAVFAFMGEAVA